MWQRANTSLKTASYQPETIESKRHFRAFIQSEENGPVLELSDGWKCLLEPGRSATTDQFMAAAIEWRKRHGADVVEIRC